MRFVQDSTQIEDIFFCENWNRTISKRYLPMCEEFFSKHDLEIQIIDSVYTDGAPCYVENIFFVWLNQDISHLQRTHCFLYRQTLISKHCPEGRVSFDIFYLKKNLF